MMTLFVYLVVLGLIQIIVSSSFNQTDDKRFLMNGGNTVSVSVNSNHAVHTLSDKFVSVTLDSWHLRDHLKNMQLSSSKLRSLSRALGHGYLRIGGTSADDVVFRDNVAHMYTFTEHDFDSIYQFAQSVGWEVIFDLNLQLRQNGQWDSRNAEAFLRYCASKGYHVNLELGNEPNVYAYGGKTTIDPAQIGRGYVKLKHLMQSIHPFNQRLLVGPAVTRIFTLDFAKKFLSTGSTAINAFTMHHYYMSGTGAHESDYISASVLNGLKTYLDKARQALNEASHGTHDLWLGETAASYTTQPMSDSFLSGFRWLDKLGIAAERDVKVVARQQIHGGSVSLLDQHINPVPDYWTTLLFKKLVAPKVLQVTNNEHNNNFRIYAGCSADPNHPHSVTFYFLNLYSQDVRLDIPQYHANSYDLYALTPGNNNDLRSMTMRLNGELLHLNGESVPALHPKTAHIWPVTIKGHSYGFMVVDKVGATACGYHG